MLRNIKAGALMRRFPAQLSPEDPAHWARELMEDHEVHHLPVTTNGLLLGMVSRDECVAASAAGGPGYRTALDIMRRNPASVSPDECLPDVSRRLLEGGHLCLPVVSAVDEVLGAVHIHDVLKKLHQVAESMEGGLLRSATSAKAA